MGKVSVHFFFEFGLFVCLAQKDENENRRKNTASSNLLDPKTEKKNQKNLVKIEWNEKDSDK
jgi:hypothetical protein